MSAAPLPKLIEPLKLVEQRVDLTGQIALAQLKRLTGLVLPNEGKVGVELRFDKDEEGISVIDGKIETELMLQCQRCLEPFAFRLNSQLQLGIVRTDAEAAVLPGYYDPLLLEESELDLWRLIEEELLLNLPIVASHPEQDCGIDPKYQTAAAADKVNPFAALEKLKRN